MKREHGGGEWEWKWGDRYKALGITWGREENRLDGVGVGGSGGDGDKWWDSGYPPETDFTKLADGLDVGQGRMTLPL